MIAAVARHSPRWGISRIRCEPQRVRASSLVGVDLPKILLGRPIVEWCFVVVGVMTRIVRITLS